jgi:ADP-heptose:LPS heptosyltransferase
VLAVEPPIEGVERIAVLRANALGDLIVALPALEALRAAYPRAEITLFGRSHHEALLLGRPSSVDRVVVLPEGAIGDEAGRMDPDEREHLIEDLARGRWDIAIQLHGGGRNSNRFVARLGARVTAGSRTPDAPALDRWVPYEHYQSEVARYLEVVGLVGARAVALEPRLPVVDADLRALHDALPDLDGGPYAVLHPGASDPRRRWPIDSFAAVGLELRACGRRLVVTGVASEDALVDALRTALGGDVLAGDRLTLPALLALLAGAEVVVANDTGPLHLAMAAGAPTVGIFWIGNLVTAGPLSRRRHRPLVSWRVDCPECGADASREGCTHDVSFVADVPVYSAIAASRSLIGPLT